MAENQRSRGVTGTGAKAATWIAQIVAAGIFVIAGPVPKLTGAEPTIALFTELGAEPFGRIGVGVAEGVALVLLLIPRTAAIGGLLTVGLMLGAIGGHLTKLGVSIPESVHPDLAGPSLFVMAVVALIAGATVVAVRRTSLPIVGSAL